MAWTWSAGNRENLWKLTHIRPPYAQSIHSTVSMSTYQPNSIHNSTACALHRTAQQKSIKCRSLLELAGEENSRKVGKLINKLEWHRHSLCVTVDFQFVYDFDACVRKHNELVVQTRWALNMQRWFRSNLASLDIIYVICEINGNSHIDCVPSPYCVFRCQSHWIYSVNCIK